MMKIHDEYLCAVRTKSFLDFFLQAQRLVNSPPPPSTSDLLLHPAQETIAPLLESSNRTTPHLRSILSDYFTISAEASDLCANLLKTLIRLRSSHRSIPDVDPLSGLLGRRDFERIHDTHSRVLQRLRSGRKRMAGKLRMMDFLEAVGPAAVRAAVRRKVERFGFLKWGSAMRRAAEQLDAAAKGAYILKRDFDTMGWLVARMEDEVEHSRAMAEVCLERGEDGRCLEVLRECEFGVSRQAEEVEEHVYLCLLTINRARAMVVREMSINSSQD